MKQFYVMTHFFRYSFYVSIDICRKTGNENGEAWQKAV